MLSPIVCGFLLVVHLSKGDNVGLCKFKGLPTHDNSYMNDSVCNNMAPRNGLYPPETTPSPWKIFTYYENRTIEQLHSQPVTLGPADNKNITIFHKYLLAAKIIDSNKNLGGFIGHFEYQWDVAPICCGDVQHPNMLKSSMDRVKLPNQTVYWTAPSNYAGPYVFVAMFMKSSRQYWQNVMSEVMNVIEMKHE